MYDQRRGDKKLELDSRLTSFYTINARGCENTHLGLGGEKAKIYQGIQKPVPIPETGDQLAP